ncbi:sigma-54 dependent transcriptional regulator [Novosphingobium sp. ST904]|uniref:sigma-54-dependent transcriptional regulator n=1 Tax=Novosphingobium sp. ST904 TaxID=1684385 RepID=UPI0006C868A4|nr:sigma-54 dependent transcriptional regulator [Novosphingobium sp. ST904]KPH59316.1 Fis family transcriptional regulator [Novosphingobium sp. ST904]TCM40579.1 two-component system C4-dicarboxylate transport response regulator DctD [Novosphingobium sp. ST904]
MSIAPLAPRRVALVEDDEDLARSTAQLLRLAGFEVELFAAAPPALAALTADWPGVVVSDVRMPHVSGIDLFRQLHERDPELPVVLVTGHGDIEMAVQMLKAGAWDFLTKPFAPDTLIAAVTRAATARGLTLENRRLRAMAQDTDAPVFLGESPAIRRLREMIPVLANADIDLFIEGETGTGKDLFARLVHRAGKRARQRFLPIACAAMPEALSEPLFAASGLAEPGLAAAHRGTLYLDDVDRAPAHLQERLLPFVEQRVLRHRGEATPIDVRVISTSQDAAEGPPPSLLPPLFYRLAAMRLRIPPLRERREDIGSLFARFAGDAASRMGRELPPVTAPVRTMLERHDWPGNLRELANFAEQFVLGLGEPSPTPSAARNKGLTERVDAFERDEIVAAVQAAGGEIGAAIRSLDLPRKTFYYKVNKHGIDLAALRRKD